jgi:Kef-type K+ transport system membrane component KefB
MAIDFFSVTLYVAVLLLMGLLSTRLMKVFRLPNVTGYIIAGIIMGPFVFGLAFVDWSNIHSFSDVANPAFNPIYTYVHGKTDGPDYLSWVSSIALGFIAFSIGSSFKLSAIKAVGKRILWITVLESGLASVVVIIGLLIVHFIAPEQVDMPLVLTLGAIAAATAPAATLMVVKQYKAKGPVVSTLLPVVALDDATALIFFAILFQIARTIATGSEFSAYEMFAKPLIEIALSLAVGAALGFLMSFATRYFKSRANRVTWAIFTIFASVGLYDLFRLPECGNFELSSLLMCMMAGAIYCNKGEDSNKVFDFMDRFTSPIYMLFFMISGASLDLTVFSKGYMVLVVAFVYLICRVIGKWLGAFSGATITHAEPTVKKYLGFTLVPQAGVAIGLATTASTLFGESTNPEIQSIGATIVAVVLTSTLIYELAGPFITKLALTKAGEIKADSQKAIETAK